MSEYQISLARVEKELGLKTLYSPAELDTLFVKSREVNRPGLELNGYLEYFEASRIIVFGNQEVSFLNSLPDEKKREALGYILPAHPPAVIFARSLQPSDLFMEMARQHQVPVFLTDDTTSSVVSALVSLLNVELAPRVTRHGVLVEVYGEGIFIVGDSGVGKSETAIELLKRGHQLVADDAVEIKRISDTLHGTAPELIRHYIEIRGVGVIDVKQLFGMGAVQFETEIDLVIQLEQWQDGKFYDRLGLGEEQYTLLDVSLPIVTIPVRPGRNLAGIVEIATMKNRQTKYGYNAGRDFVTQFDSKLDAMSRQNGSDLL